MTVKKNLKREEQRVPTFIFSLKMNLNLHFTLSCQLSLVKIFVGSLKILEDLHQDLSADRWRSLWKVLKDLQGSSKFLPRSSKTSPRSLRILEDPCMYLEDLCRNLIKSFKILSSSTRWNLECNKEVMTYKYQARWRNNVQRLDMS